MVHLHGEGADPLGPSNIPDLQGRECPDLFAKVLRLHMTRSTPEADNAYQDFRAIRERVPVGLIVIGLAIVGAVIYHLT